MTPEEVIERAAAPNLAAIGSTHVASALEAHVLRDGEVVCDHAAGVTQFPGDAVTTRTPFDLASVTKVFTATLAMQAIDAGHCELDSPIAPWVEGWVDEAAPVTLLHLLNHSSGLAAWDQFYLRMPITPDAETAEATRAKIERQITAKPRRAPPGRYGEYSDLGYMLLGRVIERLFDDTLEALVERMITAPLGLDSIRYVSLRRGDAPVRDAAATELDPRRGGVMVGRVHDENCFIQGGAEGHAGLFGRARDVARFGQHLLEIDHGAEGLVSRDLLQYCWSEAARGGDGHHVGGWDTPSGEQSSAGPYFAREATVGHLGFTGTSLWIERRRRVVSVLLTNRVYPTRENDRIKALRVAFAEALGA